MAPVEVELSRILIRELKDHQLIELKEVGGDRAFPIVIGLPEAQAIERRLKRIEAKRPFTHELLAAVIREFGGRIESVTITDLSEHTFYATLDVRAADGSMLRIDARPSDAIALGVAEDAPLYVEESVLDEAMSDEE